MVKRALTGETQAGGGEGKATGGQAEAEARQLALEDCRRAQNCCKLDCPGKGQQGSGAGKAELPGGRAVAAARNRELAGAGAKGLALAEGVAGSGDPKSELGATEQCKLPNSLTKQACKGPSTAVWGDCCTHECVLTVWSCKVS